MQSTITEIAPDTYRISTFHPGYKMQFNQFLVKDDEGSKDCVIVPYFRAVLPQPIRRLDGCDLPTGCTCDRTSPPTLTVAPIVESVRGLPVSRQLVFHVRAASIVAVSARLPTALD